MQVKTCRQSVEGLNSLPFQCRKTNAVVGKGKEGEKKVRRKESRWVGKKGRYEKKERKKWVYMEVIVGRVVHVSAYQYWHRWTAKLRPAARASSSRTSPSTPDAEEPKATAVGSTAPPLLTTTFWSSKWPPETRLISENHVRLGEDHTIERNLLKINSNYARLSSTFCMGNDLEFFEKINGPVIENSRTDIVRDKIFRSRIGCWEGVKELRNYF